VPEHRSLSLGGLRGFRYLVRHVRRKPKTRQTTFPPAPGAGGELRSRPEPRALCTVVRDSGAPLTTLNHFACGGQGLNLRNAQRLCDPFAWRWCGEVGSPPARSTDRRILYRGA
jgi:hypothetical protein